MKQVIHMGAVQSVTFAYVSTKPVFFSKNNQGYSNFSGYFFGSFYMSVLKLLHNCDFVCIFFVEVLL